MPANKPQAQEETAQVPTTIFVASALPDRPDGGHQVALWEADEAHPTGEVWIAGPAPVEVARTPGVTTAIAEGRMVEVSPAEARKLQARDQAERQARRQRAVADGSLTVEQARLADAHAAERAQADERATALEAQLAQMQAQIDQLLADKQPQA